MSSSRPISHSKTKKINLPTRKSPIYPRKGRGKEEGDMNTFGKGEGRGGRKRHVHFFFAGIKRPG